MYEKQNYAADNSKSSGHKLLQAINDVAAAVAPYFLFETSFRMAHFYNQVW